LASIRHYGGFVLAAALAFVVDISVLHALVDGFAVPSLLARPPGILLAMVVGWYVNRTITFAMQTPPSFAEFARFAAVSATSQTINYGVFAAILLVAPTMMPALAVGLASLVSMFVSYLGYRFGVFKPPGGEKP
jgi:putative flippase GtrA